MFLYSGHEDVILGWVCSQNSQKLIC